MRFYTVVGDNMGVEAASGPERGLRTLSGRNSVKRPCRDTADTRRVRADPLCACGGAALTKAMPGGEAAFSCRRPAGQEWRRGFRRPAARRDGRH